MFNVRVSSILTSLRSGYLDFELDNDFVEFANSLDVESKADWLNWDRVATECGK